MHTINMYEIDDNARRQLILEFVSNNQYCNKQYIVEYFDPNERKSKRNIRRSKINISKKTIYRIIHELVNDGLLIEEKERSNSREWKLHVDTSNPVLSVPIELDQFETNYLALLDEVKKKVKVKGVEVIDLLRDTLNIFSELFSIYNYHALLIWPRKIKNKADLHNLYLLVYSNAMNMYVQILNKFRPLFPNEEYARHGIDYFIPTNLANLFLDEQDEEILLDDSLTLPKYGLSKQTDPLLKQLIRINSQIKPTRERRDEFISRLRH